MFIVALDKVFPFRRPASNVGPTDLSDCSQGETRSWEGALWDGTKLSTHHALAYQAPCLCLKPTVLAQLKCLFLCGSHPELG